MAVSGVKQAAGECAVSVRVSAQRDKALCSDRLHFEDSNRTIGGPAVTFAHTQVKKI